MVTVRSRSALDFKSSPSQRCFRSLSASPRQTGSKLPRTLVRSMTDWCRSGAKAWTLIHKGGSRRPKKNAYNSSECARRFLSEVSRAYPLSTGQTNFTITQSYQAADAKVEIQAIISPTEDSMEGCTVLDCHLIRNVDDDDKKEAYFLTTPINSGGESLKPQSLAMEVDVSLQVCTIPR